MDIAAPYLAKLAKAQIEKMRTTLKAGGKLSDAEWDILFELLEGMTELMPKDDKK